MTITITFEGDCWVLTMCGYDGRPKEIVFKNLDDLWAYARHEIEHEADS